MSCATAVMYQPYSPYNAPEPSTSSTTLGGFNSSPERLPHPPNLIEDNNNRSHLENKLHVQHVFKVEAHLSSTPAPELNSYHVPNNTSSNSQSSPPPSRPPSSSTHVNQIDEDSCDSSISAHRLSSNIIVFTHYVGDASSVVEDHFSRALNSYKRDEPPCKPMSARNLPASFWTAPCDLTPPSPRPSTSMNTPPVVAAAPSNHCTNGHAYSDLYSESITGALHQLAADWQYHPHTSSSSSASSPSSLGQQHPGASYTNYSNYTGRFQPSNYWSPRLVGSASSSTSSVKSEWSPEPPYSDFSPHPPHHHHPYHHYSNIAAVAAAGLEPTNSSSDVSVNKPGPPGPATSATDLFWTTTF